MKLSKLIPMVALVFAVTVNVAKAEGRLPKELVSGVDCEFNDSNRKSAPIAVSTLEYKDSSRKQEEVKNSTSAN